MSKIVHTISPDSIYYSSKKYVLFFKQVYTPLEMVGFSPTSSSLESLISVIKYG
ncbi:hypothetical protein HMPREF1990_00213 [Porphyromonas gingivalis W4087]|nr:hypothetical protein HMPREF1990_00213 [Porphyromonas gingivalis W4087]